VNLYFEFLCLNLLSSLPQLRDILPTNHFHGLAIPHQLNIPRYSESWATRILEIGWLVCESPQHPRDQIIGLGHLARANYKVSQVLEGLGNLEESTLHLEKAMNILEIGWLVCESPQHPRDQIIEIGGNPVYKNVISIWLHKLSAYIHCLL
jgi:hypothetical protein